MFQPPPIFCIFFAASLSSTSVFFIFREVGEGVGERGWRKGSGKGGGGRRERWRGKGRWPRMYVCFLSSFLDQNPELRDTVASYL
ncbi:hypothetical protein BC629DRAFT_1524108, partial [Irpex lacteus]